MTIRLLYFQATMDLYSMMGMKTKPSKKMGHIKQLGLFVVGNIACLKLAHVFLLSLLAQILVKTRNPMLYIAKLILSHPLLRCWDSPSRRRLKTANRYLAPLKGKKNEAEHTISIILLHKLLSVVIGNTLNPITAPPIVH